MNQIKNNLKVINNEISNSAHKAKRKLQDITLIGVSKRHSVETIINGIAAGIKTFGENYINEAVDKLMKLNSLSITELYLPPLLPAYNN